MRRLESELESCSFYRRKPFRFKLVDLDFGDGRAFETGELWVAGITSLLLAKKNFGLKAI